MRLRSLLGIALLALPLLEIAAFVLVGRAIGVLATLGLVVLSGLLGLVLLRLQGFTLVDRVRRELDAGRAPAESLVHGVMLLAAGVLLMIPGFVTDVIGLVLFIPAVRSAAWRLIRGHVTIIGTDAAGASRRWDGRAENPNVVDLSPSDYAERPDPESPWNPRRRPGELPDR